MYPNEKLDVEKCRICGEPVEAREISSSTKAEGVLEKYKEKLERESRTGLSKLAKVKDGKLILQTEDGELKEEIENVERLSLSLSGAEIGKIKNPDYAEFPNVMDVNEEESGVQLQFKSPEREEFIEKIENLRNKISSESEGE